MKLTIIVSDYTNYIYLPLAIQVLNFTYVNQIQKMSKTHGPCVRIRFSKNKNEGRGNIESISLREKIAERREYVHCIVLFCFLIYIGERES